MAKDKTEKSDREDGKADLTVLFPSKKPLILPKKPGDGSGGE